MNRPVVKSLPFPEHWQKMNHMGYGLRLGELDVWTSGSGMGKTQFFRELKLHVLDTTDACVADIALEEPLEDTVESLCALRMNKRIHLPDVEYTDEELRAAWETTAGTGRYFMYDAFGSMEQDALIDKIRYFATALDCKYIFLDHLSIVVSGYASDGNERTVIDEIMTALKSLTVELGVWIGVIVHLRKVDGGSRGKSFETGLVPTLDDLRGSGSLKQLANSVYAVSRNQQAETDIEKHTSRLHVLKCRFSGRTGPADWLRFNEETGRMEEGCDPTESDHSWDDGEDSF
jgi:twinkle protein